MNTSEIIVNEVRDLHQFFQHWFNGTVAKDAVNFSRVASVWTAEFTLIDPNNTLHRAATLLTDTFALHGTYPKLKIDIRNLNVRIDATSPVAIATYEEWHLNVDELEGRQCSAVFISDHAKPLRWLHIHESAILPT